MMKSYSIFLPVGFLAFWISGCASNPHVVYEPVVIQTQPTWVHRAPHNPSLRQTTNVAQSQNWSVLTDPVVLDLDSQSQDPEYSDVTNVSVTQNYYVDESGLSLDDQVDLYAQCRLDYCYDQYYYPVPTTTYWYYNAYPTVWYDDGGYYNDYYNYNDYYVYYPYYSGYGWGYPSRRVVTVYDPYYSSAFYYSGYYPASYYRPFDFYNPYWSYGWYDYWGGYGGAIYWNDYGYRPWYAYGNHYYHPWYGGYGDWYYHHYWDDDWDDYRPPTRNARPMMGDRHEPIRITGAGNSPIQSEERSVTSAETKAPRTSANSPRRTTQITDIPRFSQTGVSRQNQTSAMRNNASQVNGDTYRRDERSGRTVRTSREPVGSNPSASPYRFSESPRRNPLNALNRGESDSSDSRVSTWGRSRTATPLESNLSERNRNPVQINPASQPSRQSIRVLSPERSALGQANSPTVNRAVERMNSLSSPSLPSRSYSAPVSRQPVSVQESARTYSAPMRSSRDYTTTRSSQPSPMRSTSDTSARRSYDSSPSYQRSSAPSSGSSSPSRSSYTPSSSFRDSGPSMSPSRSSAPSSPSSSGGRSVSPMRSNPR